MVFKVRELRRTSQVARQVSYIRGGGGGGLIPGRVAAGHKSRGYLNPTIDK